MTPDEIKSLRLDVQIATDQYHQAIREHERAVAYLARRTDELNSVLNKLVNAAAKAAK